MAGQLLAASLSSFAGRLFFRVHGCVRRLCFPLSAQCAARNPQERERAKELRYQVQCYMFCHAT